jgi:hypothetical protein
MRRSRLVVPTTGIEPVNEGSPCLRIGPPILTGGMPKREPSAVAIFLSFERPDPRGSSLWGLNPLTFRLYPMNATAAHRFDYSIRSLSKS